MSAKAGEKNSIGEQAAKILLAAVFAYILIRACVEFYAVAWGTGVWLGEFSLKWGIGFFGFVLFCILSLGWRSAGHVEAIFFRGFS